MTDANNVRLGFMVEAVQGDALRFKADVLAVKHSPRSSGLGAQVRKRITDDGSMLPQADEYRIFSGRGVTETEYVLMVGAPPVFSLRYFQLRDLARRFLEALWEAGLDVGHLATTLHGVRTGAGLDEVEAFRALLLGMADAYEAGHYPPTLTRISFVEQDENRVRVMQDALTRFLPESPPPEPSPSPPPAPERKERKERRLDSETSSEALLDMIPGEPAESTIPAASVATVAVMAGPDSFEPEFRKPEADETTPHVFVAMPFKDEYDDQYYLAIQPAIHEIGFLSERMDLDAFTGDIKARMLERIRTARLVIALLDGGNPNVYLEVGYAWGVETPAILAAHEGEPLPFDVRGERVLIYDRIYRLKQMLQTELARLDM